MAVSLDGGRKNTIYLLGASGFLGRAILEVAQSLDFDVYAHTSTRGGIESGTRLIDCYRFDLENHKTVKVPKNVDFLIYAANANEISMGSNRYSLARQKQALRNLVEKSLDCGVRSFCYISSTQLYSPSLDCIHENSKLLIDTNYKLHHLEMENCLLEYGSSFQNGIVIYRVANVFSSNFQSFLRRSTLVPNCFIHEALKERIIRLNSSGSQVRTFISDLDFARRVLKIPSRNSGNVLTRIIASDFCPTILQVATEVKSAFASKGIEIRVEFSQQNLILDQHYKFQSQFEVFPDEVSQRLLFLKAIDSLITDSLLL